jgi:hypothetical protein
MVARHPQRRHITPAQSRDARVGGSSYLAIANKAFEQLSKMLTEFGMTPSSRSRVSKVQPDKPQLNPRAALLTRQWITGADGPQTRYTAPNPAGSE